MNTTSLKHIIRAILILLLQVLVLKRIGLSTSWLWQYGDIFLYPVIVLLWIATGRMLVARHFEYQ